MADEDILSEDSTPEGLEPERSDDATMMDDVRAAMAEIQARPAREDDTPAEATAVREDDAAEEEPPSAPSDDPLSASIERWSPVMERLDIPREKVVDNYMSAVVALQQDPVDALTRLAQAYLPETQAQALVASLSTAYRVDPLDVDVDAYAQQAPQRAQQSELAQLRSQVFSMQIEQLRSSGDYPLLSDQAAAGAISQAMTQYPNMTVPQAYALAVHSDPDLSAKHAQAVAGASKGDKSAPDKEIQRTQKLRRATAADLPKGAAGDGPQTPTGNSVYDDVRAAAAEIGFGR